jgi:two-component system, OmpR family, alkaline phosphatase synthesis response regulator PhoP
MAKVLIVDDDPEFRNLLSRMVTKFAHEANHAINGIQAEKIAREWQPDVILLDFMMPLQDGYVTCRNLRRQGFTGQIVIMSALSSVLGTAEAKVAGANNFLHKPIKMEALGICLESCLEAIEARQ